MLVNVPLWWKSGKGSEEAPFQAPSGSQRVKRYAAGSGYSFEFYYGGWRTTPECREYQFFVSFNRTNFQPLSVLLPAALLEAWSARQHRELTPTHAYAVAKLLLFRALEQTEPSDDRPYPSKQLSETELDEIIAGLDL